MFTHHDVTISLLLATATTLFSYREAATQPVLRKDAEPTELANNREAANPLWAVPLGSLLQTRERPLFSPSRRRPAPPVVISPPPPSTMLPTPRASQDRPEVVLVGTVLGQQNIAILRRQSADALIRLHVSQDYEGWTLRSIAKREVTFAKNEETTILTLSASGPEQMPRAVSSGSTDERSNAITRFAMPAPQHDTERRCLSGLYGRTSDSPLCGVARGRALIPSSPR
jgi:hypothetical protein